MVKRTNNEEKVKCPIEGCNSETVARGLFMHIFQTDDPENKGHYPRGEIPPDIDEEEIKVTGKEEVEMNYPETQNLEDRKYLDTYTGQSYEGKRGLMIHLGQMGGKNNIPEDVTDRHRPEDFPVVEVDDNGNITEVIEWPKGDVPPIEPYLPWYDNQSSGYISKRKVKEFVQDVRESSTGAASPEAIEKALLE